MNKQYRSEEAWTEEDEANLRAAIATDPDTWEATEEDLANARPFAEVHPELAAKMRADREEEERTTRPVRIRNEIAEKFLAAHGPNWQQRINEILRDADP